MAAYDAVVRELASELQARMGDLPPVPMGEPSGLQRQQAVDSSAPRVCSPITMESPDVLYVVGGAARQVSAELDLASTRRAELPMASTERAESPLKRRETDIEADVSVAAPEEGDGEETEEVSGDESESDEEAEEEVSGDADDESGADTNTAEVIHHVDADTDGLQLLFHRQKGGDLAVRLEAPVWMLGVLMAVMTAYMWMVAFLIKNK